MPKKQHLDNFAEMMMSQSVIASFRLTYQQLIDLDNHKEVHVNIKGLDVKMMRIK